MKRSASITSHFIVLALATILLINPIAFCVYAAGRPPPATSMLIPNLASPAPTRYVDLYVGITDLNQVYVPGSGPLNFGVAVYNLGEDRASNVRLTGQLPSGLTLNSLSGDDGGSCTGTPGSSSFNCTFLSINVGHWKTISVSATATGEPFTKRTVTATVASDAVDSNSETNVSSGWFYIAGPPLPAPTPGPADDDQLAYLKFDPNLHQLDLVRQRADGAGLVNLTTSPAQEGLYTWSPDGSRLAFISYSNQSTFLGVTDADGLQVTMLTNVPNETIASLAWSPDGTRLVFAAGPAICCPELLTNVIYVVNADGTNRMSVGGTDTYNVEPAWSPDGTHISFLRLTLRPNGPALGDVYVANSDGSNVIKIARADGQSDVDVEWSLDGARLAFTRYFTDDTSDVFTVRADGSDLIRLTNNPDRHAASPHWSPDGTKLLFGSYGPGGAAAETINSDGSGRMTLYTLPPGAFFYGDGERWSPDGTKLLFGYCTFETQGQSFCVVNRDGTGLHCIGNDVEYNSAAEWSPDSQRIAFMTLRNQVGAGINVVNADGTNRVEVTTHPFLLGPPKWRPRLQQQNTPPGTNVTVTQGSVAVTLSNVTTAGKTTVTPIDPNSLQGVPGEYVINANSLAFEIHTTAVYTGPITIGFQVPGVDNPITFSTLRVLHGEPPPVPNFVDRTILAPDSPSHDFATRTIYARVTSLSPFLIAELPANRLTALGPAQIWVGLKNSDDVGTKFDLLAEVFRNGTLTGSGQLDNVAGGSSGFNNAKLDAINLALSGTPSFGAGNTLSIRLSVRISASSSHRSGTARLWFNDAAANSRFSATIGGVTNTYYLRKLNTSLVLSTTVGSAVKNTIDVQVDRAVGGNPFKPFGTWTINF